MGNWVIWDVIERVKQKKEKRKHQCPHVWGAGRIHIEEATVRVSHCRFQDGKVATTSEDPRDSNGPGKFLVECEECGFNQVYSLRSPTLPRWVTTLLIEYHDRVSEQATLAEQHG